MRYKRIEIMMNDRGEYTVRITRTKTMIPKQYNDLSGASIRRLSRVLSTLSLRMDIRQSWSVTLSEIAMTTIINLRR